MRILAGKAALRKVDELANRGSRLADLEPAVRNIVEDVRRNGDRALRKYAEKWDGLSRAGVLRVGKDEMKAAWDAAPPELREALRTASANIRRFCEWQKPRAWRRKMNGISLGQVVRPLESVGCYVPGGRHPLVSTLMMTVIPAQVAGVQNIRVVSPNPRTEVLAAAYMLGVRDVFRVGGAQAVAALAYGTETVPRVDKIVGPGNQFVTVAKKLVSFDCAIDFLAGPTEVIIVSNNGRAEYIAADLVAQAEHDPEALPIFVTSSKRLAQSVNKFVEQQTTDNQIARQSASRNGAILIADTKKEAIEWANRIAPEHITVDAEDVAAVQNAGSIFVGAYSAQAAGDYASGPNHVLPTGGVARFRGGLTVLDFMKIMTVQELSEAGLRRIAKTVAHLAETEGLQAHAQSIRVRCSNA